MENIKKFVNNNIFLFINIPLFYFFHIYIFFTYFLFYIFIKYNNHNYILQNCIDFQNSLNINDNINPNTNSTNHMDPNTNSTNQMDPNDNVINEVEDIKSRNIKKENILKNNSKKINSKKNILENINYREIKLKNINSKFFLSREIDEISSKNIDTRFFILITYITTIYYGYIFICNLMIKLFLIGSLYIIYKNYNNIYFKNIFEILNTNTNDKFKSYVNNFKFIYDTMFTKITLLQDYIDKLKSNDDMGDNISYIYYRTMITIFDYIHDNLIYHNYKIFYELLLNNN